MSHLGSVRVTVTVDVDPDTAFEVFTDEIGEWYRRGCVELGRSGRSTLQFEHGVGARLLEIGATDGRSTERGRVTVWEPGRRLVFVDQRSTEVDVRFESIATGTRVVLEHRGLDQLPPDLAADLGKHGWRRLGGWFEQHVQNGRQQWLNQR